jgi:hypothetical protein
MSLKLKALIQLIGLIAVAIGGWLSVDWIFIYFHRETLLNAFWVGLLAILIYFSYELLLARLETNETLNNIDKDPKK